MSRKSSQSSGVASLDPAWSRKRSAQAVFVVRGPPGPDRALAFRPHAAPGRLIDLRGTRDRSEALQRIGWALRVRLVGVEHRGATHRLRRALQHCGPTRLALVDADTCGPWLADLLADLTDAAPELEIVVSTSAHPDLQRWPHLRLESKNGTQPPPVDAVVRLLASVPGPVPLSLLRRVWRGSGRLAHHIDRLTQTGWIDRVDRTSVRFAAGEPWATRLQLTAVQLAGVVLPAVEKAREAGSLEVLRPFRAALLHLVLEPELEVEARCTALFLGRDLWLAEGPRSQLARVARRLEAAATSPEARARATTMACSLCAPTDASAPWQALAAIIAAGPALPADLGAEARIAWSRRAATTGDAKTCCWILDGAVRLATGPRLRARALLALAHHRAATGELEQADRDAERVLHELRAERPARPCVQALDLRARLAIASNAPERARGLLEAAALEARMLDAPEWLATLAVSTWNLSPRDRSPAALARVNGALDALERHGHTWVAHNCRDRLAPPQHRPAIVASLQR